MCNSFAGKFAKAGGNLYKWLADYRRLEEEIDYISLQIELSEIELKRWDNGDLAKKSMFATSLENCQRLRENIAGFHENLSHNQNEQEQILKLINKFQGIENKILKCKYIEGKTLQETADDLHYSLSYVKAKHAEIMRIIKFQKNE